jgi:hypothetical protein
MPAGPVGKQESKKSVSITKTPKSPNARPISLPLPNKFNLNASNLRNNQIKKSGGGGGRSR